MGLHLSVIDDHLCFRRVLGSGFNQNKQTLISLVLGKKMHLQCFDCLNRVCGNLQSGFDIIFELKKNTSEIVHILFQTKKEL